VPIPPGNSHALSTDGARLFWIATDRSCARKKTLHGLAMGPEKPEVQYLLEEITDYHKRIEAEPVVVPPPPSYPNKAMPIPGSVWRSS